MTPQPATTLRQRPLSAPVRRVLGSALFEALATPHGMSRYLEQLSPMWSLSADRAVITDVTRQVDAVTLTLHATGDRVPHRAGQFVRVTVEVDGIRRTRCYSIIDAEGGDPRRITLTIRTHAHGLVSRHLAQAQAGMVVGVSQPQGSFVLPQARPQRVLLVSGGSGITPVLAMLRTVLAEDPDADVTFLHYATADDSVLHRDELARLDAAHANLGVVTVLTREQRGKGGLFGHLDRDHLDAVAPDRADRTTFACGPVALLDTLTRLYVQDGLGDRLHREQFTPAAIVMPVDTGTTVGVGTAPGTSVGNVRFVAAGRAVADDGRTLLEQAEAAGLTPEFGCRMGICHTCTTRKTCGPVRNVVTGAVADQADEDIQLCVSVPLGDVELDL